MTTPSSQDRLNFKIELAEERVFPLKGGGTLTLGPGPLALGLQVERCELEQGLRDLRCFTTISDRDGAEWQSESILSTRAWLSPLDDFDELNLTLWKDAPPDWKEALKKSSIVKNLSVLLDSRATKEIIIGNKTYSYFEKFLDPLVDLALLPGGTHFLIRVQKLQGVPSFAWTEPAGRTFLPLLPLYHFAAPPIAFGSYSRPWPEFASTGNQDPVRAQAQIVADPSAAFDASASWSAYYASLRNASNPQSSQTASAANSDQNPLLADLQLSARRSKTEDALKKALENPSSSYLEAAKALTGSPYSEVRYDSLRLCEKIMGPAGIDFYLSLAEAKIRQDKELAWLLVFQYGGLSVLPAVAAETAKMLKNGPSSFRHFGETKRTLALAFLHRYRSEAPAKKQLDKAVQVWKHFDEQEKAWLIDRLDFFREAGLSSTLSAPSLHIPIPDNNPVFNAISTGDTETVRKFLVDGGSVYSCGLDRRSLGPLAIAAKQLPILQLLHEHGLDLNRASSGFSDPLLNLALHHPNEEIVRFCLDHGANPQQRDIYGGTPLQLCCSVPTTPASVASIMLDHSTSDDSSNLDRKAFVCAIRAGNLSVLEVFVNRGASVDWPDRERATPLIDAARIGAVKVIQWLLDHGADPNLVDSYRTTPLGYAERNGHPEAADLLRPLTLAT